jgi:hypothetical protein
MLAQIHLPLLCPLYGLKPEPLQLGLQRSTMLLLQLLHLSLLLLLRCMQIAHCAFCLAASAGLL